MEVEVTANVGTRLLFANERIRVWALELGPGEACGPHHHASSYVTVCVQAAHVQEIDQGGETTRDFTSEVDFVDWHDLSDETEPRVHTLVNADDRPYKNFIVELLDP